jgi:molybdopterin-guanine dinucleotide biosynthesis protein A
MNTADVVVAELEGQFPTYARQCIPNGAPNFSRRWLNVMTLKIQTLYRSEALRVAVLGANALSSLGVGLRSFQNINTPEDLALADAPISDTP